MRRSAVDIGTNSVRLLMVDEAGGDLERREEVTGLGRGVDRSGRLGEEPMERTLVVLEHYGRLITEHRIGRTRAVATSAVRDAANREAFLDLAERALGVRPECISGAEEARLSYLGATAGMEGGAVVVDIGGGSTEFVTRSEAVSIDIGSVRLTERALGSQPASFEDIERAIELVGQLFIAVSLPDPPLPLIGVAGTWVSLAAIQAGRKSGLHQATLSRNELDHLVARLAGSTRAELEATPGLNPARAPVILGGALIAREAVRHLGVAAVVVSERDLLDGVVAGLA